MTAVAIVAAGHDAKFAEQVRARLKEAGRDAPIQRSLPPDPSTAVVLIWSAALEAAHAIDAQALIGLWSENRLVVARRDDTPLPLGLRDLPSLGPQASERDVAQAVRSGVTETPPTRNKSVPIIVALIAIGAAGVGGWYWFNKGNLEKQAALTAALESATMAAGKLKSAQARQLEALKALEQARASGDAAALTKAQESAWRAEEELKLLEAKAAKARDDLKKSQDSARQAKAESKQEVVVATAPKAEAPAHKAEARKAEVPKAAAKAPSEPSKMSRSQRERLADEEAARNALEKAGRAPASPPQVASSAPSAAAPATAATDAGTLYEQALAMEQGGNAKDAVRIYRRAARAGSGKAAKRLGEIFDRGAEGVSRDYAESLQWYETARQLGEPVETAGLRSESPPTPKPAPVPAPVATPEPAKSAVPAPVPAPVAAPPAPAPEERKSGAWRFILVAALVLAIVFWRLSRKRRASASAAPAPESAPAPMPAKQAPADGATLFVSYSHKDRVRVEPIVSAIEDMGRRVWMDRTDITGQTGWAGQIVRAIRECRAVVLMASPNSYGSDQVVRELYLAMNHKKAIVPIEIEPAEMPDELQYILAPFQHHRLSGGETRAVLGRALAAI
jgi:hypothetical protein